MYGLPRIIYAFCFSHAIIFVHQSETTIGRVCVYAYASFTNSLLELECVEYIRLKPINHETSKHFWVWLWVHECTRVYASAFLRLHFDSNYASFDGLYVVCAWVCFRRRGTSSCWCWVHHNSDECNLRKWNLNVKAFRSQAKTNVIDTFYAESTIASYVPLIDVQRWRKHLRLHSFVFECGCGCMCDGCMACTFDSGTANSEYQVLFTDFVRRLLKANAQVYASSTTLATYEPHKSIESDDDWETFQRQANPFPSFKCHRFIEQHF